MRQKGFQECFFAFRCGKNRFLVSLDELERVAAEPPEDIAVYALSSGGAKNGVLLLRDGGICFALRIDEAYGPLFAEPEQEFSLPEEILWEQNRFLSGLLRDEVGELYFLLDAAALRKTLLLCEVAV